MSLNVYECLGLNGMQARVLKKLADVKGGLMQLQTGVLQPMPFYDSTTLLKEQPSQSILWGLAGPQDLLPIVNPEAVFFLLIDSWHWEDA